VVFLIGHKCFCTKDWVALLGDITKVKVISVFGPYFDPQVPCFILIIESETQNWVKMGCHLMKLGHTTSQNLKDFILKYLIW
jgi:hypothetical protein